MTKMNNDVIKLR